MHPRPPFRTHDALAMSQCRRIHTYDLDSPPSTSPTKECFNLKSERTTTASFVDAYFSKLSCARCSFYSKPALSSRNYSTYRVLHSGSRRVREFATRDLPSCTCVAKTIGRTNGRSRKRDSITSNENNRR